MHIHRKEIATIVLLAVLPIISSECMEFWKSWRTCPSDTFPDLSGISCFYQINNTYQAVVTETSPKEAGIVCHTDDFPVTLFNCLPIDNSTVLIFSNCPFPQLPLGQFFPYETLQGLRIQFNKVKIQNRSLIIIDYPLLQMIHLQGIHTNDYFDLRLANLPSLQILNIYVYNFTRMPEKPFEDVPGLLQIVISHGPLESLPNDFFYGIEKLLKLDLSLNGLKTFQAVHLEDKTDLLMLNLSYNQLMMLDHEIFYPTNKLEHLLLNNNKITMLHTDLFSTLSNLKELLLNNNNIVELHEETFSRLSSLQILSLAHNNIRSLPANIFKSLVSLVWLEIQNNEISLLSENLFKYQNILHYLDFSSNEIANLTSITPFGTSKYLFKVNASRNLLKKVPDIKWEVYNISNIDLSHNRIDYFVFPEGLQLDCWLNLQNNQIETVSTVIYLPPGPVLSYNILMEGNPFKCDCNLSNFVTSLSVLPIQDKNLLLCHSPWFHKYQKVITFDQEGLCSNDIMCPENCKCSKLENEEIYVDCSNAKKTQLPKIIPLETTTLNLNNNSIIEIENSKFLSNLSHLYISNNLLLTLKNFRVPLDLKILAVDGNHLSDLPHSLRDHIEVTKDFKIYLADNAWVCNCLAVSFKKWFMRNLPKIQDSMHTYCIKNFKTGERSLLVETRLEEFTCSSSVKNCESLLLFFIVLLLLFK